MTKLKHIEMNRALEIAPQRIMQQLFLMKNHANVQLDIGFGHEKKEDGNLHKFVTGTDAIRHYAFESVLKRLGEIAGPVRLVAAIGAGGVTPRLNNRKWYDLTGSVSGEHAIIELQGIASNRIISFVDDVVKTRMSQFTTYSFLFPNNPFPGDALAKIGKPELFLYPIMQALFASDEPNINWAAQIYTAEVTTPTPVREAVGEAIQDMKPGPGKQFAIIEGKFDSAIFRPLKSCGPILGRAFKADDKPDSDVVWMKGKPFEGMLVASMDSQSYTALHMHLIDPSMNNYGGHIQDAVVQPGAMVMLVKADRIVPVD